MRKWVSAVLIVLGTLCCVYAVYPILEVHQGINMALDKWEDVKEDKTPEEEKAERADGIIGILQLGNNEKKIPIHVGTTDKELSQGIGLDELTVLPGAIGNSVLYGHRENVLWELKDIEVGDHITIQGVESTLVFEVKEIKIVDPYDPYIYEKSQEPTITLVTCYPFIYMGPTPQRFVVRAQLKSI